MNSQNARSLTAPLLASSPNTRHDEPNCMGEQGERCKERIGTRVLDASTTIWLAPPSAAGALKPNKYDDDGLGSRPLPRKGAPMDPSPPEPAPVSEANTREETLPQSTARVGLNDMRDPRAHLRSRARPRERAKS